MDPNSGRIYETVDLARLAGVADPVEIIGAPDVIDSISKAVRAQHKAKRKRQKKARRANR